MNTPSEIPTPKRLEYLYAYERLLGEGTNGKTYLARDLNTGEQVAIKALKLNQSENFKSFELFKREAETLSSLNVTGVPHFYQSILSDTIGGECYIIQEYVNAPSIQSYLAQGYIFTESETLTLMYKVASILSILHTQYSPPIIHRDIKPSNVMCQRPENGNWATSPLYLIDFGAVANAHSNSDKSTIAGTVGYMAPEQNFGECLPQTDLYALGATALHMLTGVPPYDMDFDTYSLKYQDALDAHAPDVSAGMRELLGKLLSYSFDQRPASAIELLRMIENVQAGKAPNDDTAALQSATTPFLARLAIWFRQKIFKRVNTKASVFFNTLDAFEALPREKKPTMTDQIGLANGVIRCFRHKQNTEHWKQRDLEIWEYPKCVEYTFTANDSNWIGLSSVHTKQLSRGEPSSTPIIAPLLRNFMLNEDNQKLPCRCVVIYHPKDPSINRLYYIPRSPELPGATTTSSRLL